MKKNYATINCALLALYFIVFTSCNQGDREITERIKKAVDEIWIIDTHEHFRIDTARHADFFTLVGVYLPGDMISSGMSADESAFIKDNKIPVDKRWKVFYPYWGKVKNTGYGQCVRMTIKGLFGIDEISENTFKEINTKMIESNKNEKWAKHVLKDKSRIDVSIIDPKPPYLSVDPKIYPGNFCVMVKKFDNFAGATDKERAAIEKQYDTKVTSLTDYLNVLDIAFDKAVNEEGIVGIKSTFAYSRILYFEDVPRDEAEIVFSKMLKSYDSLGKSEHKKLEDFMFHQIVQRAEKYQLPIQIHTGMLSGNSRSNPIENTNAIHLSNLFLKYKDAKFILFHGSYPYMAELSYLAKSYPNVYIDMCWMYIISPSASKRYLEEWLFTVPSNKIMAFGGDCSVEWAYGHSVMARKIVTETLVKMVHDGYYKEDEAIEIAKKILRENALELFKLKKKDNCWARTD